MTEYIREKATRKPTHPGAILREDVLPDLKLSVSAFARAIHTSRQTVHRILAEERGITPVMALKIGKFCGNDAGVWLRMQDEYDLYTAEKDLGQELDEIKRCCAA